MSDYYSSSPSLLQFLIETIVFKQVLPEMEQRIPTGTSCVVHHMEATPAWTKLSISVTVPPPTPDKGARQIARITLSLPDGNINLKCDLNAQPYDYEVFEICLVDPQALEYTSALVALKVEEWHDCLRTEAARSHRDFT